MESAEFLIKQFFAFSCNLKSLIDLRTHIYILMFCGIYHIFEFLPKSHPYLFSLFMAKSTWDLPHSNTLLYSNAFNASVCIIKCLFWFCSVCFFIGIVMPCDRFVVCVFSYKCIYLFYFPVFCQWDKLCMN